MELADMQFVTASRHKNLQLAKSYFKEGVRLYTKVYGPNHPRAIDCRSRMSNADMELLND
jgi:hypothetical protein